MPRPIRLLGCALLLFAGGCAVTPESLTEQQRQQIGEQARGELFAGQEPITGPLTLAEATARALKYHVDQRQRQMEEAASVAQLEVARFDLLPRLMANAGYTTRSNEAFGFGITPAGTIGASPSASQERDRTTGSLGLSWSVLDFGVSYFRAKQFADQTLIAQERRRKAIQTLMHDVRVAWWRAEAAERLLPAADRLLEEVEQAIDRTRLIEARRLLPPVQVATLRRALLDLNQQIAFRRQDLAQARIDLAALVNAPPGTEIRVASPASDVREIPDLTANIERLESLALAQRPELAEEGYRARISENEARRALVALLPGLSLDFALNYDSNRFLVNNNWASAGLAVAMNLMKAFSLPAMKRSEEAQRALDAARRNAMAMAVMTQLRLAALRYSLVADEFLVWDEAARDDDLIVEYVASGEKSGIDNEIELIRTRARAMASHINRDLAYANVQAGVARLYNSIGYDAVPPEDESAGLAMLAAKLDERYGALDRASFSARPDPRRPSVGVGEVAGADARVAALVGEGAGRVVTSAKLSFGEPDPDIRFDFRITTAAPQDGRVPVSIVVNTVGRVGPRMMREFKTVLSEPIDDEQWRVLGEGVTYRVIGALRSARITRPALRVAETLDTRSAATPADPAPPADAAGDPLTLRLAPALLAASQSPERP